MDYFGFLKNISLSFSFFFFPKCKWLKRPHPMKLKRWNASSGAEGVCGETKAPAWYKKKKKKGLIFHRGILEYYQIRYFTYYTFWRRGFIKWTHSKSISIFSENNKSVFSPYITTENNNKKPQNQNNKSQRLYIVFHILHGLWNDHWTLSGFMP